LRPLRILGNETSGTRRGHEKKASNDDMARSHVPSTSRD